MYRHCIFCSAKLAGNEVLETFPVGRTVAFDPARGRLWAVCPRCERWNLAPLEERWEAVESAERIFRDSRLRVQSENVGLARVTEGTRLVRIGDALPGELAAWRYGKQMPGRWMRYARRESAVWLAGAGMGLALVGGGLLTGPIGSAFAGLTFQAIFMTSASARRKWREREPVVHVPAELSPGGQAYLLRRGDLGRLSLATGDAGRVEVRLDGGLVLPGEMGRWVLGRAMTHLNATGGFRREVDRAVALLADAGDAEAYLHRFASGAMQERDPGGEARLSVEARLALEMALHEGSERAAMEGELTALRAAWREAEEIARIADALPGEPPEDVPPR